LCCGDRHVRNPYMRAKFVEVLRAWMPDPRGASGAESAQTYTRVRSLRADHAFRHLSCLLSDSPACCPASFAAAQALFEGHPLALAHLVPHLLTLCVLHANVCLCLCLPVHTRGTAASRS
jgi:hypothetical protein